MPCDGVVVLNAQLREEAAEQLAAALAPYIKQQSRQGDTVLIQALLPIPNSTTGTMPCKISIRPGGKITVVTTQGTFTMGLETLKAWLAKLRAAGIDVQNIKIESHRHDLNAPQLAYTLPVQGN